MSDAWRVKHDRRPLAKPHGPGVTWYLTWPDGDLHLRTDKPGPNMALVLELGYRAVNALLKEPRPHER